MAMHNVRFRILAVTVAILTVSACGEADAPGIIDRLTNARPAAGDAAQVADADGGIGAATQQMAEDADAGVTIEPVDFRALRDLLPEEVAGLPRVEAGGEKSGTMGLMISKATGEYRSPARQGDADTPDPAISVTVTDLGALRGAEMMGHAGWTTTVIDRETSTGYERTATHEGHPSFEKFDSAQTPTGEIHVLVAQRFMIEVRGQDAEMDHIKQALARIDIARLEGMKDFGVARSE